MASSRITGTNEDCVDPADPATPTFLGRVGTFGTSGAGRDYTSWSTFEANTDIDLVTNTKSMVLECYDDSASFTISTTTFAGATVDASYFRIIRVPSAERHDNTPANGFNVSSTNAGPWCWITEGRFSMQDVIIKHLMNASSTWYTFYLSAGDDYNLIGMIMYDGGNDGAGSHREVSSHADNHHIVNSLMTNCLDGIIVGSSATNFLTCYNVTATDCSGTAFGGNDSDITCTNCIGNNNGTSFAGTTMGGNYNATDDAGAVGGANDKVSQDFSSSFVDSANDDFTLVAGDTVAGEAGTDLSADGEFAFDDDIGATTRPVQTNWDIGFHETTAAAGGRIMSSLAAAGGLVGWGGIAGKGGGLAGQ